MVLDCRDPQGLAAFWSQATAWPASADGTQLISRQHPTNAATPRLELLASEDPKQDKNRVNLDGAPPPGEALDREVTRLEAAGARRIDMGQRGVSWVMLADPEGNELCVLTPR